MDTLPINPKCFANHMGIWCCEANFLRDAVRAIKAGIWQPKALDEDGFPQDADFVIRDGKKKDERGFMISNGVAIVPVSGPMMKGDSKFGGVNTLRTRRALREASRREDVKAIVLHIDSPGGQVSGTADLAADVRNISKTVAVHAHIDDMGASAAFWIASQARTISAGESARIGSLGTFAVIEDTSKAAEMEGVEVHLITTGEFKGAGSEGVEITDAQLAEFQREVDALNAIFMRDVKAGRSRVDISSVNDGRTFMAQQAIALGLIDKVRSFEDTIRAVQSRPETAFVRPRLEAAKAKARASEFV